jgi:hypothetical protein
MKGMASQDEVERERALPEERRAGRDDEWAFALGFHRCYQCEAWFHESDEGWADCVGCGRYCPDCAAEIDWQWCPDCGLLYCPECAGGADFRCEVCGVAFVDDEADR